LKLREKMRRPAANRADPKVSPSNASMVFPSKENVTLRSRLMRSPACGGSLTSLAAFCFRPAKPGFAEG
jgi:hypothetical protein